MKPENATLFVYRPCGSGATPLSTRTADFPPAELLAAIERSGLRVAVRGRVHTVRRFDENAGYYYVKRQDLIDSETGEYVDYIVTDRWGE